MATNITAITDTAVQSKREQSKQFQGLFSCIPFLVTLEDDSLAAQVAGQCDIAVPGAKIGDFVFIAPPVDVTGLIFYAYVSADDVVTLTTFNVEGTDANTSMATATAARGLVLSTRDEVWADPDA
jgi:hypothetical protein